MSNYIPKVGDTCLFQGNDLEVLCVGDKMVFGAWLAQEIMVDKREVSRKKTPEQVEEEKAIDVMACYIELASVLNQAQSENLAQELFGRKYHNQPKVKALSYDKYAKICNDSDSREAYMKLSRRGYTIEAKENNK